MLVMYKGAGVWFAAGSDKLLGYFCGNYTSPAWILSPFMDVVMQVSKRNFRSWVIMFGVF
jgi:hypothetical protein